MTPDDVEQLLRGYRSRGPSPVLGRKSSERYAEEIRRTAHSARFWKRALIAASLLAGLDVLASQWQQREMQSIIADSRKGIDQGKPIEISPEIYARGIAMLRARNRMILTNEIPEELP